MEVQRVHLHFPGIKVNRYRTLSNITPSTCVIRATHVTIDLCKPICAVLSIVSIKNRCRLLQIGLHRLIVTCVAGDIPNDNIIE